MEKEDEVVFSHFKLLVDILRKEIFTFKFIFQMGVRMGWKKFNQLPEDPR